MYETILSAEPSRVPREHRIFWRINFDATAIKRSMELVVQHLLLRPHLDARNNRLHIS